MAASKRYSVDSLSRALQHHEHTGAVEFVSRPGAGQPKWRIRVHGAPDGTEEFTSSEVHAMCLGLAAAERTHKKEVTA